MQGRKRGGTLEIFYFYYAMPQPQNKMSMCLHVLEKGLDHEYTPASLFLEKNHPVRIEMLLHCHSSSLLDDSFKKQRYRYIPCICFKKYVVIMQLI